MLLVSEGYSNEIKKGSTVTTINALDNLNFDRGIFKHIRQLTPRQALRSYKPVIKPTDREQVLTDKMRGHLTAAGYPVKPGRLADLECPDFWVEFKLYLWGKPEFDRLIGQINDCTRAGCRNLFVYIYGVATDRFLKALGSFCQDQQSLRGSHVEVVHVGDVK